MRVLVCGATGCVGGAVAHALRSRDHRVVEGSRAARDGRLSMHVDFMQPCDPRQWAERLAAARIEVIVNCVGILMPSRDQSFERVHTAGPVELYQGAELAGVRRVLQVSALGAGGEGSRPAMPYLHSKRLASALGAGGEGSRPAMPYLHSKRLASALGAGGEGSRPAMPYLHSKRLADDALAASTLDWAVLRPSLIYGTRSQSAALFATLASLPVIGLPGRGMQRVQPIHVYEVAEAIARLVEQPGELRVVHELGGPSVLSYRDMLAHYRSALGLGTALWLPVPMPLMRLNAWFAEALPQKVFCRDTIELLERGSVPAVNASANLLGREPSAMAHGLAVTPPEPMVDLRVHLSPLTAAALRASLAFMWLYTALVSAWLPHESGVLRLLARCGFDGPWGIAAMIFSCGLNLTLGVLTLRRPTPLLYAAQFAAVIGYTATAAFNMPELTIDHCGPLAKNVPVLALVLLLWIAHPLRSTAANAGTRRMPKHPHSGTPRASTRIMGA